MPCHVGMFALHGTEPAKLARDQLELGDIMGKTLITAAAAAALLASAAAGPVAAPANTAAPAAAAVSTNGMLPCSEEDYAGPVACYWDATQQGNGTGISFTWTGSAVIYSTTR